MLPQSPFIRWKRNDGKLPDVVVRRALKSEVEPRQHQANRLNSWSQFSLLLFLLISATVWGIVCTQQLLAQEAAVSTKTETQIDLVLRFQWMCDTPQAMDGEIRSGSGQLTPLNNLSMDACTTGAYWNEQDGKVLKIHPRGVADRLGIDVHYVGSKSDKLDLRLKFENAQDVRVPNSTKVPGSGGEQVVELSLDIASLIDSNEDRIIAGGIRMWVGRTNGDNLRVRLGNGDSLVFSAGEKVPFFISPNNIPLAVNRPLEMRVALMSDTESAQLWQRAFPVSEEMVAQMGQGLAIQLDAGTLTIPETEGVYTLVAKLVPAASGRLVDRIARPEFLNAPDIIAQRAVQFVALEALPPAVDPTPMSEIAKLNLHSRSWLDLGIGTANQQVTLPPGGQIIRKLPIVALGQPHVLVIRYPNKQSLKLGISIRQEDNAGNAVPLGIDSAICDEFNQSSVEQPPNADREHRIVFWPRSREPFVVISNSDPRSEATLTSATIEAGPKRLTGGALATSNGRTAAIYLDKPLIADAFSCDKSVDHLSGVALDDWTTFLQGGQRLVEYVQSTGANGAIVSVMGEGGAIFPSSQLFPTPRYDTGIFFSDGRDPIRKDVVELWMRLFDRAGLRFIPSLEFATPLPQLEQSLSASDVAPGIDWVDSLGRKYVDGLPPRHGLAPYYNLLDPRVGQQVVDIVSEFQQRYSHHRSFRGLGIQLGPQTFLQLPSANWGRDATTLKRFRDDWTTATSASGQQPQSALPSGVNLNSWIDQQGTAAFVSWRSHHVTQLFQKLAKSNADQPVMLLTADFLPPGNTSTSGDALQYGLDWTTLTQTPGILPFRVVRERLLVDAARRIEEDNMNEDFTWDFALSKASLANLPKRNADRTIAQAAAVEGVLPAIDGNVGAARQTQHLDAYSTSTFTHGAGALLFRPPVEQQHSLHFTSALGQPIEQSIVTFSQSLPVGIDYQRRLARLLEGFDPQVIAVGGWTPSFGQEKESMQFLSTFAKLPNIPFADVPAKDAGSSVVRVRQAHTAAGLVVYAINTGPWTVSVDIATDAAAGTPVQRLGNKSESWVIGQKYPTTTNSVQGIATTWGGQLQPGELVALEVLGPSRGVAQWSAAPLDTNALTAQLLTQVEDLKSRVAVLGRPRPFPALTNGSFELGESERVAGWLRAQHPSDCIRLANQSSDGQKSLVMRTDSGASYGTWILSEPLPTPDTGRMAISLKARTLIAPAKLRVAIEGRLRGAAVRHSTELEIPANSEWPAEPFWLRVENLPTSEIQDLRIAIDLITPGEISIDDVKVYDFFLTDRERGELQQQTFVALERLRRGDLTAAARLLDSHWAKYLLALKNPVATGIPQTPVTDSNVSAASAADSQTHSNAPESPTAPATANRWRSWLPEALRF